MQLQYEPFTFTLLTPCFSGTALGRLADQAEMRIPPIRGHVRFWHRALFDPADANRVWGSTDGNEGQGSRVALRLTQCAVVGKHPAPVLPHDLRKSGKDRMSVQAGESFTFLLQRLVGCTLDNWDHAQKAVRLWLLLGCLGLRSNRAAGSVWPEGNWVPDDADALKEQLQELGYRRPVGLAGLDRSLSANTLRETASDTVTSTGRNHPRFGGTSPRDPSPTKFEVARLGRQHVLLITGPELSAAFNDLKHKPRWQALGPWQPLLP